MLKFVKKQFIIEQLYLQQRDNKGNPKGTKLEIIKPDGDSGKSISVFGELPVLSGIELLESMDSPSLYGKLTLIDKNKTFETLKLSPLDSIHLNIREKGTWGPTYKPQIKKLTFSVISVSQTSEEAVAAKLGPAVIGREIEIEFASPEHYILNYSYFDFMDQDFIGPISGKNGIVQYLSDKAFNKSSKKFSSTEKPINADETSNYVWLKKHYDFYPWGKPSLPPRLSSFMQMLTENAVDKKNPNAVNFMFWQDLDGWNFKSVESIIKNTIEYPTYKFSLHSDDGRAILSMGFMVEDEPESDYLDLLNKGVFGSNYLLIEPKYNDPYARFLDTSGSHEMAEVKYDYVKDYNKWEKIETIPLLSFSEYVEEWSKNKKYDQFYGYFEPNFFNRKKSVPWEYYGYTYSSRQEETTWQTMFDITDLDGEILKKIQKEIKEPLAKKKQEYARKMNLKEKWKVYRCSICCAGLMDEGITGNTFTNELSTYEIVSAGSFTDVFNYDANKVNPSSMNPFIRSGLTLSYNLNESPYNLSLGEFFNLQENPDNFTKYRFDLEIARHRKILEVLNKNKEARQNRINEYVNKIDDYEFLWNTKVQLCVSENCEAADCVCPTEDPFTVRESTARVRQDHEELKEHEQQLIEKNVEDIIEKLTLLKKEFLELYGKYWSRKAFFFSKNLDFTFLKSQNNLFNVKSIRRIPIKGSKYEPFATRKAFAGFTFPSGQTQEYLYSISKNECSAGITANPYFDRKYSNNRKSDIWESFDNPFKNYPYSENVSADANKGPIWYRNWRVKYKYKKIVKPCITLPIQNVGSGCDEECNEPACRCSCSGAIDTVCNGDDCSSLGTAGVDYVEGTCESNPGFASQCVTSDCVIVTTDRGSGFGGSCPQLVRTTASCCEDQGGQLATLEEICTGDPAYAECSSCDEFIDDGDGGGGEGGTEGIPLNDFPLLELINTNPCTANSFNDEYVEIPNEMYFEAFSNDIDADILNTADSIKAYVVQKLSSGCDKRNPDCIVISSIRIFPEGDEPKLIHPWGGDLLNDFNYNDYKAAGSLFNDDLADITPPRLQLEGLESFVRIEFKQPIGLETLKQFPEGFLNTAGSEYFMPYIVLLTAGPFGAESARTNISVIGQDPYGFDVAVKKTKNKDDFAGMNLFDSGAYEAFDSGGNPIMQLGCSTFATSSSWFRKTQNSVFYRPTQSNHDLFTPTGIQDIFSAASWERSAPVKTWWDMWVSLPPVATSLYYNRHDVSQPGKIPFYKEGSVIGKPAVGISNSSWPQFLLPDTENIASGVYRGDAAIFPNEHLSVEELSGISFEDSDVPFYVEKLIDDPSNYIYRYADFPHISEVDPNKQYPVISYPVGTLIYGGGGFTAGQVWKYDSSRKTEYGIVQLSSDSVPSILAIAGGLNKNIEKVQKYYAWWSNKLFDWYQNAVFDNNFSAQFVVFAKQQINSCKNYPCANASGYISENNCPTDDPLCNCPCQDIRPDKIQKVKDRFTGSMVPASDGNFGPEPSSIELRKLKEETKECKLIEKVLGKEWLGCVWEDQNSPYNCNCPCIGSKFYDYMKYNQFQSTFWSTPLHTPLYRTAQMGLLTANEIQITVPGDLAIKTGQIISIDGTAELLGGTKKRYHGKWLVYKINHIMNTGEHLMVMTLIRDSNSNVGNN